MFPQLAQGEFSHRSVIKSLYHNKVDQPDFIHNRYARDAKEQGWRMLNFEQGMEQLPRALENMLRDR